jgi:beta-fructofuranosidase
VSRHPDPAFPALHGRPARGWLNDPNGCAHVDGRYHVFFQYNPHAPVHDRITWGHASSADLVSWRPEPVALSPRPGEPDSFGCWSGCLLPDGGVPTAVYSGVRGPGGRADVLLARGTSDLRHWRPDGGPVAPPPGDERVVELRDPFVLTVDGHRYAIQGAGAIGGPAQVLVYDCADLTRWVPLGPLLSVDDPVAAEIAPADVWECPNLARIDGHWVLVVSLWRHRADGGSPLAGVRYLIGDLDTGRGRPRFTARTGGRVDLGDCLYAPHLLAAGDRVLLWGWARDGPRPAAHVAAAGWSGALTFARELTVADGALASRLVPELVGLRAGPARPVEPGRPLPAPAFEVQVEPGAGPVQLVLVTAAGETAVGTWATAPDRPTRALVDGSLIEIEDGRGIPCTVRGYPGPGDRWLLRTPPGLPARVWPLADPTSTGAPAR